MALIAQVPPIAWALYTLVVNAMTFALFGINKSLARAGLRRISEGTLLGWAFVGGTPGAYAGRAFFRHKTRKQPFSNELHTILVMQLAAIAFAATWWAMG